MRNFFKAFLAFLVLALIAQLIHKTTDQNDQNHTISNQEIDLNTESSLIKKDTTSVKEVSIISTSIFKTELTRLNFKHKFITSSKNTRVIFPNHFFYFKDSIFNFLNKNQEKELVITGNYLKNEVTKNGNLGIERANDLKNKLVKYGVNPKRVVTRSNLSIFKYDSEGYYAEGIVIEHRNMNASKLTSINNKTLYSKFDSQNFKPDRILYAYVLEVKYFLQKNPNSKISIIGYTNNIRKQKGNYQVSNLQRAKNVAQYFISQGINANNIKTKLKKETSLIQNNKTNNRRIEISIN